MRRLIAPLSAVHPQAPDTYKPRAGGKSGGDGGGEHGDEDGGKGGEASAAGNDEDWEAEANVVRSYDPMAKCLNSRVLLMPRGMSKAQRKKFREKERKRHEELKKQEEEGKNTNVRRKKYV